MIDESILTTSMQRHARKVRGAQDAWQGAIVGLIGVVLCLGFATFVWLNDIDYKIASLRSELHYLTAAQRSDAEAFMMLRYRLDSLEEP